MDRRWSGSWWLPNDPSRKVIGTVTREGEAWRLDLVGTLTTPAAQRFDGLALIPQSTLFGRCKGTPVTIRHCYLSNSSQPQRPMPPDELHDDDQFAQVWIGHFMIEGGHSTDETLYTVATCEIDGLSVMWSKGGLPELSDLSNEYKAPAALEVDCNNGRWLQISAGASTTSGKRLMKVEEVVRFSLRVEGGLSLRVITDEILEPIRMLMAINFARPVDWFNLVLHTSTEDSDCWLKLDPEVRSINPEASSLVTQDAAFDAARVDIGTLLARWLDLARISVIPMAVAEPHGRRAMLQTEVVEMVNAAETLHRIRHADGVESSFATRVKEALGQLQRGALNHKERKKVMSAVRVMEVTLERRLQELAADLGEEFCEWFFGHQMLDWAYVSSSLRNALSHGYPTKHSLEKDTAALAAVHQVTRAIVQLNLLVAAGLPADAPLVALLSDNYHYRQMKDQKLLNWRTAATTIREPAGSAVSD